MKKIIYFLTLLTLLFSCQNKFTDSRFQKFSLSGKTNNLPDGTILYFTDILTNQIFDSVLIYDNSFEFESVLPVYPFHLFLHTKDYSASKSLWAENSPMILDASTSDFGKSKVYGSKTQDELEALLEQIDTIESEKMTEEIILNFISSHPDSRVSSSMLAGYSPTLSPAIVKKLFNGLSTENKESVYGLQILKYIELNRKHEVGDKFTDFEMKNTKGEIIKFSENLGRSVTLLEFWASWCGPCRKQNPDLVKTYKRYSEEGFEIFSVSLDFSKAEWEKAIASDNLTWNHVSDLKGRNSTAGIIYGINAIPDNFLIDKNGVIIAKYIWGDRLVEAIENALYTK
jgi:peroxiredoxin